MRKGLISILTFITVLNYAHAQSTSNDFSEDLYSRSFQYYFDSVINQHHNFDELPCEIFQKKYPSYNKYLIVAEPRITYKLPDTLGGIVFTKINRYEFCTIKDFKKDFRNAIFISPAEIKNLTIKILILDYYTKDKNCQITYNSGYEFEYEYNLINKRYSLEKVIYHIMVIK
jgi:hypothetical protein